MEITPIEMIQMAEESPAPKKMGSSPSPILARAMASAAPAVEAASAPEEPANEAQAMEEEKPEPVVEKPVEPEPAPKEIVEATPVPEKVVKVKPEPKVVEKEITKVVKPEPVKEKPKPKPVRRVPKPVPVKPTRVPEPIKTAKIQETSKTQVEKVIPKATATQAKAGGNANKLPVFPSPKAMGNMPCCATGEPKGSEHGTEGESSAVNADEMALFKEMVRKKIEKAKRYPSSARRRGKEGAVRVRFTIQPNGDVAEIQVVSPCHCEILNKAACKAVKKAGPFHPRPAGLEKKDIKMEIRVAYRLR